MLPLCVVKMSCDSHVLQTSAKHPHYFQRRYESMKMREGRRKAREDRGKVRTEELPCNFYIVLYFVNM